MKEEKKKARDLKPLALVEVAAKGKISDKYSLGDGELMMVMRSLNIWLLDMKVEE